MNQTETQAVVTTTLTPTIIPVIADTAQPIDCFREPSHTPYWLLADGFATGLLVGIFITRFTRRRVYR